MAVPAHDQSAHDSGARVAHDAGRIQNLVMVTARTWKILLVLIAMSWGVGFPLTKNALAEAPVFSFLFLRFTLAAIVMLPWIIIAIRKPNFHRDVAFGLGLGVAVFVGYALQTMGLERTSVTHTAFLTGLYSVFTPLLDWIIYRKRLQRQTFAAVLLALLGLWFISGMKDFHLQLGDLLVILCALSFSFQIIWLSRAPPGSSSTTLAFTQVAAIGLLSLPSAIYLENFQWVPFSSGFWWAIIFMAVVGSSISFLIQSEAQKSVPPTQVALILLTEPLWGAVAGGVMSHERLPWTSYMGGGLLIVGVLLSEFPLQRFLKKLKDITSKRNRKQKTYG